MKKQGLYRRLILLLCMTMIFVTSYSYTLPALALEKGETEAESFNDDGISDIGETIEDVEESKSFYDEGMDGIGEAAEDSKGSDSIDDGIDSIGKTTEDAEGSYSFTDNETEGIDGITGDAEESSSFINDDIEEVINTEDAATVNDIDPESTKSNKRAAKAPAAQGPNIYVDVLDTSGNAVSSLGGGFTIDLYEMPLSEWNRIQSKDWPNQSDYQDYASYVAAMKNRYNQAVQEMEQYHSERQVTSGGQLLGHLDMESDASEENPYILVFMAGVEPDFPDADVIDMMPSNFGAPFGISSSEYFGQFSLTYDGESVTGKTGMTEDSNGALRGTVIKNNDLVSPSVNVTFDAADYVNGMVEGDDPAYPLYARAALMTISLIPYINTDGTVGFGYSGYSVQSVTSQVTGDGNVTFSFPKRVSPIVNTPVPSMLAVGLYSDEGCTEPVGSWKMISEYGSSYMNDSQSDIPKGVHEFAVSVQNDGSLKLLDMTKSPYTAIDEDCAPEFVRSSDLFTPTVGLEFIDDDGYSKPEDFPVYAKVILTATEDDGTVEKAEKVAEITSLSPRDSLGNITSPALVEFSNRMSRTATFEASLELYKDEDCTIKADGWQHGSLSYLLYDDEKGNLAVNNEVPRIRCTYWKADCEFNIDFYSNTPQEDYPAYLKLSLYTYSYDEDDNQIEKVYTEVVPFNGNGNETIKLNDVARGDWSRLSYAVYSDEECRNLHSYWNSQTDKYGFIEPDGSFYSYADEKVISSIAFSHVTTDTITVPVDSEIGSVPAADSYPVYVRATLSGPDLTPITVTKKLSSGDESKGELVFNAPDGELFESSTGNAYTVSFDVYTDAECTVKSGIWSSGSFTGDLSKNKRLTRDGDAMGIHFRPVSVTVDPEAYELTVDEEHPLYIKVTAERPDNTVFTWTGVRTDLEAFDVNFNTVGYAAPYAADINSGEHWNIEAVVCNDSSYASASSSWSNASDDAIVTLNDGLQVRKQKVTYVMNSWGGTVSVYSYEFSDCILMPEYSKDKVDTKLNVHVNVPSGNSKPFLWNYAEPGYYWHSTYEEALHLRLYRMGTDGLYHYWDDDRTADYGSSYHYIGVSEMDDEYRYSYDMGRLEPGTYYLGWYMGNASPYTMYRRDPQWISQDDPVKITVTDDGRILDENGDPFTAEVYMKEGYRNGIVNPLIDVETKLPDDFNYSLYNRAGFYAYDCDKTNPYRVEYTFKPLWDNAEKEFDYKSSVYFEKLRDFVGRSYISTYGDYYKYNYRGDHSGPKTSGWMESGRLTYDNYSSSAKDVYVGWPVGDYELSYGVVDVFRSNSSAQDAVQGYSRYWYKDTVRVHLASDGKIYKILDDGSYDTEPYVMQVKPLEENEITPNRVFDKLTIKVNTRITEGLSPDLAFSDDETFRVMLCEYNWRNGNYQNNYDIVAYGDAKITETGETTIELRGLDGGQVKLNDDTMYEILYGTYTSLDEENNNEPIWSPKWCLGLQSWPLITDEGKLINSWSDDKDEVVLDNYSLLIPWNEVNPESVTQPSGDAVVFKPMTDYTQLQDKGNYMVVVHNQYDDKWYALSYDGDNGYQICLEDVTSIDDLKNGYKFDESSGAGNFIMTANKVKQAEGSVQLQFKSGAKDENGKAVSVKMGTSSLMLDPLFSSSAGTIIVKERNDEDPEAPTYQIWKGGYAVLNYTHELFGRSGFDTISYSGGSGSFGAYPTVAKFSDSDDKPVFTVSTSYSYIYNGGYISTEQQTAYIVDKPASSDFYYYNQLYMYMPDNIKYTEDEYLAQYAKYLGQMYSSGYPYLYPNPNIYYGEDAQTYAPCSVDYYILTDVEEVKPSEENNTYTLVKTFGDFYNTFVNQGGSSATMLLVYKDEDGNEYALNPKGSVRVQSKASSNGYNKIIAGAENELIPDNNSGTSSTFSYELTDVLGTGEQVFTNPYALRKSRLNNAQNANYVTLNGEEGSSAWTKSDDSDHGDGLVYVMQPTGRVLSQSDWDTPETYKLRVIRNGETKWLGLKTDDNGKQQMSIVNSEDEALEFYVYAPVMTRYYSSAYGSDFYRYYRIYSVEEINEGDELLIVYNDGTKRHLVAYSLSETSGRASAEYGWNSPFAYPALDVLDSYSTINVRDDDLSDNVRYQYRLDSDGQVKKPYAYFDEDNAELIWAQGVASNAVGTAKKESKTQRKYESVTPLGNQMLYMYLKNEKYALYHNQKGEVNFLPGDEAGLFLLRGGKTDAYLAQTTYFKSALNLQTGRYENSQPVMSFDTISTTTGGQAAQFEIYKKSNVDDTIRIEYYDTEKELKRTVIRPQDTITLLQDEDLSNDGKDYIFVGWTPDPDQPTLLGLDESTNLFDYDDIAKRASLKPEILEKYGLLGDCDPGSDNIVTFDSVSDHVQSGVLKLYPVYAVRGFSQVVTADEEDGTKIVGISDFKDRQMGGDGNSDARERWLGSINIEVYKDGSLWVPEGENAAATMYFAYHNDDAADLNIKFIAENVTNATLSSYLSDSSLSTFTNPEPTEQYIIDAVVAEQGGSEDGLKYRYNWIDQEVGGQLDNVKGGSTVKIYVTTKYQVKYYLDIDDGNGYQELVDPVTNKQDWTNRNFYTTAGTENAVEGQEANTDYLVTTDSDYSKLINQTSSDNLSFTDDAIKRGDYSKFLYKFDNYPHTILIAALPGEDEIPDGKSLTDPDNWIIRDSDLNVIKTYPESSSLTVTETTYGTGNTVWSYKGASDDAYTYHLYAKVASNSIELPSTGGIGTMKFTVIGCILILAAAVGLIINNRRRRER